MLFFQSFWIKYQDIKILILQKTLKIIFFGACTYIYISKKNLSYIFLLMEFMLKNGNFSVTIGNQAEKYFDIFFLALKHVRDSY